MTKQSHAPLTWILVGSPKTWLKKQYSSAPAPGRFSFSIEDIYRRTSFAFTKIIKFKPYPSYLLIALLASVFLSGCGLFRKSSDNKIHFAEYKKLDDKYHPQTGVIIKSEATFLLYKNIDAVMGVPYCWGGTSPRCFDCSGFTSFIFNDVYHKKMQRTADAQYDECRHISKRKLKEGDLVFFRIDKNSKKASHVGIYLGNQKFVHASTSKGVRVDSLDDDYYKKYYSGAGRVK